MSHRLAGYKLVTHSESPRAPPRSLFVLIKGVSTAISRLCNGHTSRQTHTLTHRHVQLRPRLLAHKCSLPMLSRPGCILLWVNHIGFSAVCWWSLKVSCKIHCQGEAKYCKRATVQRNTSHNTRITRVGQPAC